MDAVTALNFKYDLTHSVRQKDSNRGQFQPRGGLCEGGPRALLRNRFGALTRIPPSSPRFASVELVSAERTTGSYQAHYWPSLASVEFISAERTTEGYNRRQSWLRPGQARRRPRSL